jgi:hypothetical protein
MDDLIPITPERKSLVKAKAVAMRRKALVEQLKAGTIEGFREFWFPTEGVTTQQLADEFGTNCCKMFDEHAATIVFLKSLGVVILDQDCVPPKEFTRNEDGSVTIAE